MNTVLLSIDPIADVMVTATGGKRPSANIKTGPMIQVQAAPVSVNPVEAYKTGADVSVCFDCPVKKFCYVNKGHAPLATWKVAREQTPIDAPTFDKWAGNRSARLGSWGDPAAMPINVLETVLANRSHTGYSHQWDKPEYQYLAPIVMASVETIEQREQAVSMGWRTFRIIAPGAPLDTGEIVCPNYTSGGAVQCADCMLCSGADNAAADIVIPVHGTYKTAGTLAIEAS